MSQRWESEPPRTLAKGCQLRFFIDYSQPKDSSDRHCTELSYDGQPDSQIFEVPLHWHKYHDEWMQIIEGEADIIVENRTIRSRAGDEAVFLPRRHRHGLKCLPGVKVTMRERTRPTGRFKEWFFRDAFAFGSPPPLLHFMRVCWDGDNYPSLPGNFKILDQLFVFVFGGFAKMIMPARTVPKTTP